MPDNLKVTRPLDGQKINTNQEWEVRDWSRRLGVSKDELIDAVDVVGNDADDVKDYLGK